jgi:flavin-binding protein dodecin
MSDHVYKSVEITGTSTKNVEEAVRNAVSRASKSLHNMRWFEVVGVRGEISKDEILHWQVTTKIGFTLDEWIVAIGWNGGSRLQRGTRWPTRYAQPTDNPGIQPRGTPMSIDEKATMAALNRIVEHELASMVRYTQYSLMIFGHARIPIIS